MCQILLGLSKTLLDPVVPLIILCQSWWWSRSTLSSFKSTLKRLTIKLVSPLDCLMSIVIVKIAGDIFSLGETLTNVSYLFKVQREVNNWVPSQQTQTLIKVHIFFWVEETKQFLSLWAMPRPSVKACHSLYYFLISRMAVYLSGSSLINLFLRKGTF